MLSDQRTAALVTPQAQINWLCVPRIDSPAIFAALLGGPEAGHFSIKPLDDDSYTEPTQTYLEGTLVYKPRGRRSTSPTTSTAPTARPHQAAGRTDLIRQIEGNGRVQVVFAPRLDFGRVPTRIEIRDGSLEVIGAADLLILRSAGVDWLIEDHGVHQSAVAEIDMARGPVTLQLRYGPESTDPESTGTESLQARPTEPECRELTIRFWSDWADGLRLPEVEPEMVRRSALTLKALCYEPTGAILAAATTSLPEFIGGVRNWDYRYCWIRDAAMSASALLRLGSTYEAAEMLNWLSAVIEDNDVNPNELSPLYTVDGRSLPQKKPSKN